MSADTCHVDVADSLVGDSLPMRRLRAMIAKVAPSDIAVLIQGPTGSGKELVARAIHTLSGRQGRFVAFNVCAIAETVFEDALFGHVRGAYTGALSNKPGYLCEADRGTLFLDEVSGLPLAPQAKLLRALETREYRPVGATQDRRSDFRALAATNMDLDTLVTTGCFRPDLRYRLGAFVLSVPALRDRRDDIATLVARFGRESAPRGLGAHEFTRDAVEELVEHDWPGNVRELRHVVDSLLIIASGPVTGDDVATVLGRGRNAPASAARQDFLARRLLTVLEEVGWRVPAAALVLGVSVRTVYRWTSRFGLRDLRSPPPRSSALRSPANSSVTSCDVTRCDRDVTDCHHATPSRA